MGASKKGWENAHHAYLPVSYDLNQWSCLNQPEQSSEQSLISNMIMKIKVIVVYLVKKSHLRTSYFKKFLTMNSIKLQHSQSVCSIHTI